VAYNHKYENCLSRRLCRKLYRNLAVAWTIKSGEELEKARDKSGLCLGEVFVTMVW